jgi:hypothetical protein
MLDLATDPKESLPVAALRNAAQQAYNTMLLNRTESGKQHNRRRMMKYGCS